MTVIQLGSGIAIKKAKGESRRLDKKVTLSFMLYDMIDWLYKSSNRLCVERDGKKSF